MGCYPLFWSVPLLGVGISLPTGNDHFAHNKTQFKTQMKKSIIKNFEIKEEICLS